MCKNGGPRRHRQLLPAGLDRGCRKKGLLIAPAYTFLLNNRAVDYQFWLNIGSEGWSRRLYQPLTHPYVLSRGWLPGARYGLRRTSETRESRDARDGFCWL